LVSDLGHPPRPSHRLSAPRRPAGIQFNISAPENTAGDHFSFMRAGTSGINDFSTGLQGKSINGAFQFK